ncbi:CDP-glycerol glycerophosphotransferase family protein [Lacisediminihabitans changchengi]|uniref:CDP-glycerol glycerophosphotransferase family protein n=1 Tax=Lacisediminihabitans changchengi TaxID=2787634 RepID=A0A934SL81_9MICO|nr:CDP-glycerol glycerophosphotransferase family protein [Lacisediminihabitans changchengi]MBK4347381.1 CDP-glycerol glycerophosphotransferase family protein [Lacisediminihabitans changchengi]
MPRFTFSAGNARKLLALPLYALGAIAAAVVPRRLDAWVFGSGPGIGEGALELFRYVRAEHPSIRAIWLAKDETDVAVAAGLGIRSVVKTSARGLLATLRAEVIVVTHGFGDANRYGTRGAFVVQLWHGIPLKLIQLDSPATLSLGIPGAGRLRGPLRRFYRRGFAGISLMPAASELSAQRLRTAFGLPESRVVVTGDPRDDVLARPTPARDELFSRLGVADHGQRTVLFAPTWRDGEPDPGAPTAAEWQSIVGFLDASDALLVVRPHHLGVGDYAAGPLASPRVRMLGAELQTDITPLLPAFDTLITDYSSIAFDYSLTGGPIFYFAPDQETYTTSRGLYEPYRRYSGGREVRSWTALLGQLERFAADADWAADVLAHTAEIAARHFEFHDGENTARVFEAIRLSTRREGNG